MKIYAQEILKRNFQFLLFVVVTIFFLISVTLNLRMILKSQKPVLIAIDLNGTRIVSEESDPIFKSEAVNFIQRFILSIYNFDSINFMKKIGSATNLMSESLWETKRSSILDLKSKVERDEISIAGKIEKITKDEQGLYHVLVKAQEKNRLNIQERKIQVTVGLKAVPRSLENPWGMEVDSYEETLVRD